MLLAGSAGPDGGVNALEITDAVQVCEPPRWSETVTRPSGPEMVLELFEDICDPSDTLPVGALMDSAPAAVSVNVAGVSAPAGRAVKAASTQNVQPSRKKRRILSPSCWAKAKPEKAASLASSASDLPLRNRSDEQRRPHGATLTRAYPESDWIGVVKTLSSLSRTSIAAQRCSPSRGPPAGGSLTGPRARVRAFVGKPEPAADHSIKGTSCASVRERILA
jgi:hypothetical protein